MDDLISRAAAIAEIDEYLQELYSCISEPDLKLDGYKNGLQVAIHELNELPAVDAAPVVHGRWETVPLLSGNFVSTNCSVCGEYPASRYWKYCPHCGAKMDRDESDEQREANADG